MWLASSLAAWARDRPAASRCTGGRPRAMVTTSGRRTAKRVGKLRTAGRKSSALREHLVEHAAADVGHEVGELAEAHLDALPEVVGDDHPLLRGGGVVEV